MFLFHFNTYFACVLSFLYPLPLLYNEVSLFFTSMSEGVQYMTNDLLTKVECVHGVEDLGGIVHDVEAGLSQRNDRDEGTSVC